MRPERGRRSVGPRARRPAPSGAGRLPALPCGPPSCALGWAGRPSWVSRQSRETSRGELPTTGGRPTVGSRVVALSRAASPAGERERACCRSGPRTGPVALFHVDHALRVDGPVSYTPGLLPPESTPSRSCRSRYHRRLPVDLPPAAAPARRTRLRAGAVSGSSSSPSPRAWGRGILTKEGRGRTRQLLLTVLTHGGRRHCSPGGVRPRRFVTMAATSLCVILDRDVGPALLTRTCRSSSSAARRSLDLHGLRASSAIGSNRREPEPRLAETPSALATATRSRTPRRLTTLGGMAGGVSPTSSTRPLAAVVSYARGLRAAARGPATCRRPALLEVAGGGSRRRRLRGRRSAPTHPRLPARRVRGSRRWDLKRRRPAAPALRFGRGRGPGVPTCGSSCSSRPEALHVEVDPDPDSRQVILNPRAETASR